MSDYKYLIIGRGHAGWYAQGSGQWSNSVKSSGGSLDHYIDSAEDGALVYDGIDVPYSEWSKHVIGGPMCDASLEPNDIRKLSGDIKTAALEMSQGMDGLFKYLAVSSQDDQFCGLDSVGIGIFESILRKLTNIRIGYVRGGALIWESVDDLEKL